MTVAENTAVIQLVLTGVLIIGTAAASAYKIIAKVDEITVTLKNHCATCVERHNALDRDIRKLDKRLGVVETDVDKLALNVEAHHAAEGARKRS